MRQTAARVTSTPIAAALARYRLFDVAVRTGIQLTCRGGTVTVRCPLPSHGHPDRTPSMRLYLDDDHFYCFGCHARGDVIEWAEQTEGVGWRQAIDILDSGRQLANAWNWAAPTTGSQLTKALASGQAERPNLDRTSTTRVQEAVDAAWQHCTIGPLHARGVAYLESRRIDVTVLEAHTGRFEVGHTPAYGASLLDRLRSDGFTAGELVDAGLAHRYSDGRLTDFYHERVLIPIRDDDGRIAGLVGRNVGDPRWAKYKNPPRTVRYNKSVNLYQPLRSPVPMNGRIVVVEGTIDAIAVAVAAVGGGAAHHLCPVTQSGHEMSANQIESILRMHPVRIVAGFDGDAAGRSANERLAAAVRACGRECVVVNLPRDLDPASWIEEQGVTGTAVWLFDSEDRRVSRQLASRKLRHVSLARPTTPEKSWAERRVEGVEI